MKPIDLESWDELEHEVTKLHGFLKDRKLSSDGHVSKPLFRGQRSVSWNLKTTLERYLNQDISVELYNYYLTSIHPAVESYTGKKWLIENDPVINERYFQTPPNYEFMTYARHHGFPSPLLDWSQSLYIALFFAFQKAHIDKRVAVYAYVEYVGDAKGGCVGAPQICELGPYVSTDKRHFMQQGQYTVSVEKQGEKWAYCSHEKYFSSEDKRDQDYLVKFTLPGLIKHQVLSRLQSMNINAFTLFDNEDSLMDMLAFKEIMEKKR
jgi:FRG domain-containing protein